MFKKQPIEKECRRVAIPESLEQALAEVRSIIEESQRDPDIFIDADDAIQVPNLCGGRVGQSPKPFDFTYYVPGSEERWYLSFAKLEIDDIADAHQTDLTLYCCADSNCTFKTNDGTNLCSECDYVPDSEFAHLAPDEAGPRLAEMGIEGVSRDSKRDEIVALLGEPKESGGDTKSTIGYIWPWIKCSPHYFKLTRGGYRLLHGFDAVLPTRRYFDRIAENHHFHTRKLADFLVALASRCRDSGILVEHLARENTVAIKTESVTLYPDAAFRLRLPCGRCFNFLVELDNSTERVRSRKDTESIERKIRGYDAHQSMFDAFSPDRYVVLFVTTRSQQRLAHILAAARALMLNPQRRVFLGASLECHRLKIGNTSRRVSVLVAVLCYSRLCYIEFSLAEKKEDFYRCITSALQFFGGSPRKIIFDNLKSAVISGSGRHACFHPEFLELCGHFCMQPIACARRDPESKGMLRAGPAGQLTGMSLYGTPIRDVGSLASAVRHRLPPEEVSPSSATAIIRCDQALKYEHAIHVLGVVHGPRETPLVENVRLERTGA